MNRLVRLHYLFVAALVLLTASVALGQQPVLVSVNTAGTNGGNGDSNKPSISADGRFVAFESTAANLTAVSDTNGAPDIFVRDLQTGVTTLVSVNVAGTATAAGVSGNPSISADGRFVAFDSTAANLVSLSDTNNTVDIFVRDLLTGVTTLISVNNAGNGSGNAVSQFPIISANGRTVAFQSNAVNLTTFSDTNNQADVFARDLQLGATRLLSVNSAGTSAGSLRSSLTSQRVVSDDGRFVVFESEAGDLVPNDTNGSGVFNMDVFVRDLQTATTILVTVNTAGDTGNLGTIFSGAQISGNGRFVAFESRLNNLVTGINDLNGGNDIFVRDLTAGTTTVLSLNTTGTSTGNRPSHRPSISADGRFVAFDSDANDLVPNDTNNGIGGGQINDVFVRDLQTGTTALVSINNAGTDSGSSSSFEPQINADGRFVLFESGASNLTSDSDFNSTTDIFVRDLQTSATFLISKGINGEADAIQSSSTSILSRDGLSVAFSSNSSFLTTNDQNGLFDVFAVRLNVITTTPTLQFSQASYTVSEGATFINITVIRSGNTSAPASVKYSTGDATDADFRCDPSTLGQLTGVASRKCDYHIAVGRLRFAAGETTKQFTLSIVNDVYVEAAESLTLTLSNPVGAVLGPNSIVPVTITDNDAGGAANPIDNTQFFVRQLYVDLLSREPDPAGQQGWITRIDQCGQPGQPPPPCDRVTVAGDGFLRSGEFFDRQFFVLRLYRTGLGRILRYDEVGDLAFVSGFLTAAELELNKQDLAAEMVLRAEFANRYNPLSNAAFVATLLQTAGVSVPQDVQNAWVAALDAGSKTRAQVYREISERPEVSNKYLHEAQVVSAYYGFFTRNPDAAYLNFLQRLDSGEINLGDLANAFINAAEYRSRFGQ
jgi:Calx-beta domain/WD40-like Beta Propeller Repeat